jgi:Protein of unknown function (DUF4089)
MNEAGAIGAGGPSSGSGAPGAASAALAGSDMLAYVRSAAALLSLPLDEAQALRVATHLTQTAALARQLEPASMAPADEPAQLYCPLPFPMSLPLPFSPPHGGGEVP